MNSINGLSSFVYTRQANSKNSTPTSTFSAFSDELQGALSDMYVTSNQYSVSQSERASWNVGEGSLERMNELGIKATSAINSPDVMMVPLNKNELPELMNVIENALTGGKSLESALQSQIDKHIYQSERNGKAGVIGNADVDLLYINKFTGEVVHSYPKTGPANPEEKFASDDAVKELADDFATFLRYRAFPQEGDNPEDVERLITEIKSKQNSYNTDRFDKPYAKPEDIALEQSLINGSFYKDKDKDAPIDYFMNEISKYRDEQYKRLQKFHLN